MERKAGRNFNQEETQVRTRDQGGTWAQTCPANEKEEGPSRRKEIVLAATPISACRRRRGGFRGASLDMKKEERDRGGGRTRDHDLFVDRTKEGGRVKKRTLDSKSRID